MDTTFATDPVAVLARQISTPGLGDHSYVVVAGDRAAVIDPQRDIARFDAAIRESGATLSAVIETHVHNDYVSGGPHLAAAHGATYYLPAESEAAVAHRPLGDGEECPLGEWCLVAIHTPGHTAHHMSYALTGPDGPVAVFSGGSMLVGAIGRSDLLGAELAETLTRRQYRSVRRLAESLPDPTSVQPTHGAGSFCAATACVPETTSTIERERLQNPALIAPDEETFVAQQLAGLTLYPAYYAQLGPLNRRGAAALPVEPIARLTAADLAALDDETRVVDLRPARMFADGHIPRSINIPLSDDTGVYLGWLLPWDAPFVLVAENEHDLARGRLQLARIGVDAPRGAVADGLATWRGEGRPLARYRVATFEQLEAERPAAVIDARDPIEAAATALDGTLNIHVSQLPERAGEVPSGEVWVHCATGFRSAVAASVLEQLGRQPVAVVDDLELHLARRGGDRSA